MGVTIHYSGSLIPSVSAEALVQGASAVAMEMGWEFDSMGTRGTLLTIFPHPDCEPLTLDPNENGALENWVKTQFAGPEIHIQIADFLARIAPCFETLTVQDEAAFWETRDRTVLEGHMDQITEMIGDMQRENPSAKAKVRKANGHIVDLIS
jgi:hypothetical protein